MKGSLKVTSNTLSSRVDKLLQQSPASTLSPDHSKRIAENLFVDLFVEVEKFLRDSSAKVCCGAAYLDASVPLVLVRCSSSSAALNMMQTHGRGAKPHRLKWTKASYVKENLRYIIHPADHFYSNVGNFGTLVNEMRVIRNHISHRSSNTRSEFQAVTRKYYGATVPSITPGTFLVTNRFSPPKLELFGISCKAMAKALLKG